jgi:hypothetical protein
VDLNAACWLKRKFKCPLKKTQPSCPGSRDLNWTGKGLIPNMGYPLKILINGDKNVIFQVYLELLI